MKADAAVSMTARGAGWRIAICLILIAFSLQSYITQTHIHNAPSAVVTKSLGHSSGRTPLDDNPMDCPFCQAVAHDGPFFLPAAALFIVPTAYVQIAMPAFRIHNFLDAPAYMWQSRAPPKH